MTNISYIIFIIFIQTILSIQNVSSGNDLQVAFLCGRPSNVYRNKKWVLDFQQNCVRKPEEIVAYCRKSFPLSNILTAEPANEKVKFTTWCDFSNGNCDVNIEIQPFKCLDKQFQSDALILPKSCQFGHLFNQTECIIYKTWTKRATEQCIKQKDWSIKSYGMLFPCGENEKIIKPMYFRGIEFVCCPNHEPNEVADNDVNLYKNYLNNAILETEIGEQKLYENAEKTLIKSEKEKESNVINDFKDSEKSLNNLWITDPEKAKQKEKSLIYQFKNVYNSIQQQFIDNKEQLLNYHDDRLQFIFSTKLTAAQRDLQNTLNEPEKNENKIYEAMKNVMTIILNRKKYLLLELEEAKKIRNDLVEQIYKHIKLLDNEINQLFNNLNQVPLFQFNIKRKLMNYFTNIYPKVSKPLTMKTSIYSQYKSTNINDIIAKYIHNSAEEKDGIDIHYDLGLDDKDQYGHFGKHEPRSHKMYDIKSVDKKLLFGVIFGVLSAVVLLLIIGSGLIINYQKKHTRGYTRQRLETDSNFKTGFGEYKTDKCLNDNIANVYENPNYLHTSFLGTSQVSTNDTDCDGEELVKR